MMKIVKNVMSFSNLWKILMTKRIYTELILSKAMMPGLPNDIIFTILQLWSISENKIQSLSKQIWLMKRLFWTGTCLLMIFFPLFLLCITLLFTRSDNQFRNYESCIFTKSFCRLNCFVKKDTNTNKQSRVVINWRNFVFMILKLVAGSSEQDV